MGGTVTVLLCYLKIFKNTLDKTLTTRPHENDNLHFTRTLKGLAYRLKRCEFILKCCFHVNGFST